MWGELNLEKNDTAKKIANLRHKITSSENSILGIEKR
jgi:hypothetical protein